jgi:putative phosphoserine phosphatase/1-acylglycerol-3-phosphate O-acyltransferase
MVELDPVRLVRSAAAIGSLGVGFATGATVALVNRDRRTGANVMSTVAAELALASAGVQLSVTGEQNLWSHRPAVFTFNHQSQLDVAIMAALLRHDFTAVAKKSLQTNPIFGPIGYLARVAFIDRTDAAQAREALEPVIHALQSGTSIAIAPEGTRSGSGELLPFKKGPFHMAIQGEVPLVPVVIRNAYEVMVPHSYVVRPGTVDIVVLPPMDTSAWSSDTVDEHRDEVWGLYHDTLQHWPGTVSS